MAGYSQIVVVLLLFAINISTCTIVKDDTADLVAAEANGKLEIIKQIKKVNEDGSYTIGYEADDGSFKIESRDVLGNIKGTYGYIDDHGEIKRVSYSTSNSSEIITSTNEPPSVVQRIPSKLNRTSPTTRRPYSSSTEATPTTTIVQSIPRRRLVSSTPLPSTTQTYIIPSTTLKPTTVLYETSTPARILAQSKPLVRGSSSSSTQPPTQKSEGQLLRPEVTLKPTDMPLYRRLPIKTTLLDEETKPVTEEPEVRGNLLRRQLPQEKINFDPRQHVANIQQGAGDDIGDVYSASITTGAPRPLFTTLRPRIGPTVTSPLIQRPTPTIRYAYQRPITTTHQPTRPPPPTTEFTQESSSTEPSITPSPVPVVQIPPNNEEPQRQQFVELRHPFHRGAILVPVNQLQGRRIPPQTEEPTQEYEQRPENIYMHRGPKFRPIPVHVDEHGYIREIPQEAVSSTPYPVQHRPPPPPPQYISQADIINEVDQIKPPVSTRDFQKLLEQLIQRQSRLEKISTITKQQQIEQYRPQRPVYQNLPLYQQGPVQFIPRQITQQAEHRPVIVPHQQQYNPYQQPVTYTPPSYHPTKRMARLQQLQEQEPEYLPAPVREMLLLRMLQLAINPSLPLEVSDNMESATTPLPRKDAVRNVEILGEDNDEPKRPSRTKRYKEIDIDYYD